MNLIRLQSTGSTNRYCELLDLRKAGEFTCVWALEQTAGIGQRGNSWSSRAGENLTFSLVLKPTFLPAARQFELTKALSLALCDLLDPLLPARCAVRIKWPNDIYALPLRADGSADHRKICGILVSNRLQGNSMAASICGIGLNVNQTDFPPHLPNPASIKSLTGADTPLEPLLMRLLHHIEARYAALRSGADLTAEYHSRLLLMGQPWTYLYGQKKITATVSGTDEAGHLILVADDGRELRCSLKEISPLFGH